MSYRQCGWCPSCGAPIWMPMVWFGIYPPPPQYSCNCHQRAVGEPHRRTTSALVSKWEIVSTCDTRADGPR